MTRSGITDLANRVRQSEGQYGAQRVERAADEIPNLEKLYQDQALMRAFTGDNAQAVMTMKPSDFERYAAPLGSGLSDRSLQNIIHLTDVQNRGGFSDVPYLNINKKEQGTMGLPYISGHEGRHRNRAMDAAGEQAGLVQLVPRSELREPFPRRSKEEYLEALYKEMQLTGNRVKPEAYYLDPRDEKTYQRQAIELPEFYAQGGMVDSAPEEAIKNTITDPQAFRMLDMDLANLALMNQKPQRMAGGGIIHMGRAGAVTDAVNALEKARNAGRVESLKQREAKLNTAMSKYANGEKLSLEETSLLRLNHPAGGGVNLSRLPSEYSAEYDMERMLKPKKIITPQSMVGGASVPLVGDSAAAGKRLIAVDGSPLSGEANLDGGSAFMRDNADAWSSGQGVVTSLDNQIERAFQGADKVYGPHVSMSGTGGDFNAMTTNTLLNMFDPADISAGDAAIFNNRLRTTKKVNQKTGEITYPYADFVGIHHPDLRQQLLSKVEGTGNLRSGFVEEMNKGRSRELGFPEPASARFATSDRALLDKPIGSTGYDIAEFAPTSRIITNPKVPHGTYPVNLAGDYAGSFQDTVPADVYFKDFYEGRRLLSRPTSSDTRAFTMSAPIQYHDQAWLDNIMKYINDRDAKIKLGGYAEGGAVHLEDGGDVELPTGGVSQEVGANPLSIYNQNLPKPESSLRIHPRRKSAPDGEPSTMEVARQLGKLAKEQAGEEWDTLKANPVRGALDILNRGMVAGNVGAPVDIVNMGLQGVNYLTKKAGLGGDWASEKPVMGSKWIEDKMDKLGFTSDKKYPMLDFAANFINPVAVTAGAARAAPVVGEKVLKPLAEKSLSMIEQGADPLTSITKKMLALPSEGSPYYPQVFAGSKSQGADLAARDVAKARLAAGEDPALVWKETGWAAPPWAPNDLRYEISDAPMTTSAPAALDAKLDKQNQKISDMYYAQQIKNRMFAGETFQEAVTNERNEKRLERPLSANAEKLASKGGDLSAQLKKEIKKDITTWGKLSGDVGDYVEHPEFFAGYPDFAKDIKFKTLGAREAKNFYGMFSAWNKDLSANAALLRNKPEKARETILHELQHAVQAREGFNPGGTSKGVADYPHAFDPATAQARQTLFDTALADTGRLGDLYRKKQTSVLPFMENQELIHRIKGMPEHTAYEQAKKDFFAKGTPDELYKRLAGEAEARLTQSRKNLTQQERLDRYPYEPQRFKNATGYDLNDIIANPPRGTFRNGGAARHPSIEEMRIEMMERKHG
jgi:hypothetical protein